MPTGTLITELKRARRVIAASFMMNRKDNQLERAYE
jgi:hypothetical protein